MLGFVEWVPVGQRGRIKSELVGKLPFYRGGIVRRSHTPEFLLRRRALVVAKKLQCRGVTRAIFPERFPYEEIFARCGIRPVRTLGLCRALTAELVQALLARRGLESNRAVVAVSADHLTPEIRRIVTELCIRNRYVQLETQESAQDFCRQLRREYGVSLVRLDSPQELSKADVAVLLAPRGELDQKSAVLRLYEGQRFPEGLALQLPPELEAVVPRGCGRLEFLSALYEAGALHTGDVTVTAAPMGA